MSKLVLMRHGQSQWNLDNKFTGFTDVELTPLGEEEARTGGDKIRAAGLKFAKVFTSTLVRAIKTAELAMGTSSDGFVKHEDLRERDYGALTGLNKEETAQKYGKEQVHIWRRSYDVPPPEGESLKDVVENRVRPYFNREILPLLEKGEDVLVAAHGNTVRGILIVIGARTPENINDAEIPTGAPLVFEFDEKMKITKEYFL